MGSFPFEKLAPLTGIISLILFCIGAALLGIYEYLPIADKLKAVLDTNASRIFTGGYLGSISAFFMIWFAGSVYSELREQEGGKGRLSMVAFGGGVASGVSRASGFSAILTSGRELVLWVASPQLKLLPCMIFMPRLGRHVCYYYGSLHRSNSHRLTSHCHVPKLV